MSIIKETKKKIDIFKLQSKKELKETALMLNLLRKSSKTYEDRSFIRQQTFDLVKISAVITIVTVPGGSFALAFIETNLRKINRTIFPTSFSNVVALEDDDTTVQYDNLDDIFYSIIFIKNKPFGVMKGEMI